MNKSAFATALAAAVSVSVTLTPFGAGAVGIYNGEGGVLYLDWLSMEDCNAFTAGTSMTCFGLAAPAGGGSGNTGPVLQRANGEATLVVGSKRAPVVVATGETSKSLQDLFRDMLRKGNPKKDPVAFRTAFDAAYKGGTKKVDDAVANALSQQFKARIETQKR